MILFDLSLQMIALSLLLKAAIWTHSPLRKPREMNPIWRYRITNYNHVQWRVGRDWTWTVDQLSKPNSINLSTHILPTLFYCIWGTQQIV
jgi:hypothetical protein